MDINHIIKKYEDEKKITMITCYDFWSAKILSKTDVDCILIGDSAAMVMHGHNSTFNINAQVLSYHVAAVRRGAPNKFIVADMPFMSCRKTIKEAIEAVEILVKAGANAVKIEGVLGQEEIIEHIIESGVPVMGHLGYIPQFANRFGSKIVQGKDETGVEETMMIDDAISLYELGCFALVLECVVPNTAKIITEKIGIPTIGIGAGIDTSGQVLVLQDMLGANADFKPKFLKKYADLDCIISKAVNEYCQEVEKEIFPSKEFIYSKK